MAIAQSILSTLLAFTLLPAPPPTPSATHVETVTEDDSVTLFAFDDNHQLIASLALFVESDGAILIVADYPDGFAQLTITSDSTVVMDPESTLPPHEVAARVEELRGVLPEWARCALLLTAGVVALSSGNLWGIPTTYYAACYCVGKLEKVEIPC